MRIHLKKLCQALYEKYFSFLIESIKFVEITELSTLHTLDLLQSLSFEKKWEFGLLVREPANLSFTSDL